MSRTRTIKDVLGRLFRRPVRKTFEVTVEYEDFQAGDIVSPRPGLWWPPGKYEVERLEPPQSLGDEPKLYLRGYRTPVDARHFRFATRDG